MEIHFLKIHTGPNDLLFVNYLKEKPPTPQQLKTITKKMCRRHSGVGANGTVFVLPGVKRKIRVFFFSANGEESFVINDALFCMARFLFDSGYFDSGTLTVETSRGERTVQAVDSTNFSIEIGPPYNVDASAELNEQPDRDFLHPLRIENKTIHITPIQIGFPGAVFFHAHLNRVRLKHLSEHISQHSLQGLNVQPIMACVTRRDEILIQSWFRDFPLDFSSLTGMALTAAVLNGFTDREALVKIRGFYYYSQWRNNNSIYVTAASDYVFSGTYYFKE